MQRAGFCLRVHKPELEKRAYPPSRFIGMGSFNQVWKRTLKHQWLTLSTELVASRRKGKENTLARKENQNLLKSARQAAAIQKVKEAIEAIELCEGELSADGYKELRTRLGHLMDALYKVGQALSKSTWKTTKRGSCLKDASWNNPRLPSL